MQYFIIINDVQQGPFSLEELRARHITSDTLVWAEGMAQWMPAWQVDELKPLIYGQSSGAQPTPPPPPVQDAVPHGSATVPPDNATGGYGAVPPPLQPATHSSHWFLTWIGGAVAALLLIMAMTNPSKDEHRMAISDNLVQGVAKGMGESGDDNLFGFGFLSALARPMLDNSLGTLLQYHNYVFWSTTTINVPGHGDQRTSLGMFGKVFTVDEEDVAKGLGKAFGRQGSSTVRSITVTGDDDNDGTDVGEDDTVGLGRQIGHTVINKVSRQVKKEIEQQADSAEADGLDKIVDGISRLLKDL